MTWCTTTLGHRQLLGDFGPYFTEAHVTPWGPAVNLDQPGSDEVRAYLIGNALMWLRDYHLDGLRLDAVHALEDRSALHFLEELSAEVHALSALLSRELILIAESDINDPRLVTSRRRAATGWPRSGATTSTTRCTRRSRVSGRVTIATSGRSPLLPRR